jgi:hypothetical protein
MGKVKPRERERERRMMMDSMMLKMEEKGLARYLFIVEIKSIRLGAGEQQ